MTDLFKHPVWAMAFRPFYSLAALYGACLYCFGASAFRVRLSCRVFIGMPMK